MIRVLNLSFIVVAGMFLSSCEKTLMNGDGTGGSVFNVAYGELYGTQNSSYIVTDGGTLLNITENRVPGFPVEEGKRIIANYRVLSQAADGYNVRLNDVDSILTKKPVYLGDITEDEINKLGNDPIYLIDAWFGGTKYLNLRFELLRSDPNLAHLINVAIDGTQTGTISENEVVLTLRHNAYGDILRRSSFGRVSFDISGLIPEGETQTKITLKWKNYLGQEKSISGYFKGNTTSTLDIINNKDETTSVDDGFATGNIK